VYFSALPTTHFELPKTCFKMHHKSQSTLIAWIERPTSFKIPLSASNLIVSAHIGRYHALYTLKLSSSRSRYKSFESNIRITEVQFQACIDLLPVPRVLRLNLGVVVPEYTRSSRHRCRRSPNLQVTIPHFQNFK
jgi:hypothetical protein